MKKILIALAEGFEEVEAMGACDFLRRVGFTVTLAGVGGLEITGAHGIKVIADKLFTDVKIADIDALVLPGGMPGSRNLYENDQVLKAVLNIHQKGKIVAAICAAPMVLARAGLLANRTFTAYPGVDLGIPVKPTARMVECDGRVITGKGPGATFAFAMKIAEELGSGAAAKKVMQDMFVVPTREQ